MGEFTDPNSYAENPGSVELSEMKCRYICDEILRLSSMKKIYFKRQFPRIADFLRNGDTQPAIVVSSSPLIISAYSDEMDAVAFLSFPDELAEMYSLTPGTRLTTSNVYYFKTQKPMAKDLTVGKGYPGRYADFSPLVQLFIGFDDDFIRNRANLFLEGHWQYVEWLTSHELKSRSEIKPRDGLAEFTRFNLFYV